MSAEAILENVDRQFFDNDSLAGLGGVLEFL